MCEQYVIQLVNEAYSDTAHMTEESKTGTFIHCANCCHQPALTRGHVANALHCSSSSSSVVDCYG